MQAVALSATPIKRDRQTRPRMAKLPAVHNFPCGTAFTIARLRPVSPDVWTLRQLPSPELIGRLFGTKNPLPNLKADLDMANHGRAGHPKSGERHLVVGFVPAFTKALKEGRRPVNADDRHCRHIGIVLPGFC
jgi:hypothetical protein